MNVAGFWKDLRRMLASLHRRAKWLVSKRHPEKTDPVRELANQLHPKNTLLKIEKIEEVGDHAKRYTLAPVQGGLPPFAAGQYISFDFAIHGILTTRAYSLCSPPSAALNPEHPYVQIAIKKVPHGLVSEYIEENWKEGTEVNGHLPYGEFHLQPLIDSKKLCFIAGGSGVTPFLSMLRDIQEKQLDYDVTLFYGIRKESEILCKEDLERLKNEHAKIIYVVSDQPDYSGEKGFVDAKLLQQYTKGDITYFLCGPAAMMEFVTKELQSMGVEKRRIRREAFGGQLDVRDPAYPLKDKATFRCIVHRGCRVDEISVSSVQSVAVALENAGIKIHTCCRSGVCGACRIRLVKGELYVPENRDGRRAAEKELGYYYACSSFPLGDVEIETNIEE